MNCPYQSIKPVAFHRFLQMWRGVTATQLDKAQSKADTQVLLS